ncbi:hypothetical protein V1291_003855 [Nitrobacteraceae bacterium AZCC 1564]
MFEFGEDLLDRIEIWAVGRQEEQMGSGGADGIARRFAFVTAEIVEDDEFALAKVGASTCSTYRVNSSPLMGASTAR